MSEYIEDTSKDFSKFIITDVNEKMRPLNKLIDDMHARLEEFQTMVCFAKQERLQAINLLTFIYNTRENLGDLFERIDSVEHLVDHVRNTLNALERDIEKVEEDIGYTDSTTTKVANIFTPLFKKTVDKSESSGSLELFKTSDYFEQNLEATTSTP